MMYGSLLRKTDLVLERFGPKKKENQRIKNIEIEMHKKIKKTKNFTCDSCYDFSDYSEDSSTDYSFFSVPKSETTMDININSKKQPTPEQSTQTHSVVILSKQNTKKLKLRIITKYNEIILCVLAIIGVILSQIENEDFYNNNKSNRIGVIKLITALDKNEWNISKINITDYNISYIIDNSIDISNIDFSNVNNIPLNMIISTKGKILRIIILITSILCLPFIIIGNYLDYLNQYHFKGNDDTPFIKTIHFPDMLIHIIIILPFQYPIINGKIIYIEMDSYICFPISSILATVIFLRVFLLFKLFNHLTKFTNVLSEHVCEKYLCKANSQFAYKAFLKENPLFMLCTIFILSCVCFGLACRNFERYYWEFRDNKTQDWDYLWNCMWFVFVSMTTAGYGDIFTSTQVGRVIAIFACIVGVYFVAMLMVYMTQITSLSEKEKKAYSSINKMRLRKKIIEIQGRIVYSALNIVKYNKQKEHVKINSNVDNDNDHIIKQYDLKCSIEKRKIENWITKIKSFEKEIESFGGLSLTEMLFDISERIENQINEITQEILELQTLNEMVLNYTSDLMNVNHLLKKSLYATKLLYGIIGKYKNYGKLNDVKGDIANIFDMPLHKDEIENEGEMICESLENISPRELKERFDFLLSKKKRVGLHGGSAYSISSKSMNYLKALTHNSMNSDKKYRKFKTKKINKIKKLLSKPKSKS